MLLVRVDTDDGLTGWGEAWSLNLMDATRTAIEGTIAPLCIGEDAGRIAELMLAVRRTIGNTKAGPLTYGVSGVDIALWDLLGKAAGLPLHRLFGGSSRPWLEAYASLVRFSDPEIAVAESKGAVARGYRHLKLHETTFTPVAAVRDAVGTDVTIRLDPAWAWTPAEAVAMARRLVDLDLVWLEEPIWPPEDFRGLQRVAAASGIPLAAGENAISLHDFRLLLETDAIAYAEPSVIKIGGLTELRKVMALAEAFNVAPAPHSYYLGPGLVASLHAAAAWPQPIVIEHAYFDLEADLYGDALGLTKGGLRVPQAPGLGLDPDLSVIADYRCD